LRLPDLEELLGLRAAARTLSIRVGRPSRALLLGSHHSRHRGRGLEFEEVRPYVAGDDPRSIDWRVTARRGRVHTKLFREERERPVWLLVDLDTSLFFGSRRQLKSTLAVRAAALLAWVAAAGGDRVGGVIANSTSTRLLPPRSREAGVLPLLSSLVDLQPRAPGVPARDALQRALRTLSPLVHPGSLVMAVSDFASHESADPALWSATAAHSECRWLWITDPLERKPLPNGRLRAGSPAPVVLIDGASLRPQWLAAWHEREARVRSSTQALGIELLELDTSQEVSESLAMLLRLSGAAA
jgi:uncharacterized protein (DUF58 family)